MIANYFRAILTIIIMTWILIGFANNNLLVLSDIHLNTYVKSMDISPSGRNFFNDLDVSTFKLLIHKIQQEIATHKIAKPDCILVLGDISGHLSAILKNVYSNENLVYRILKEEFPSIPIFYTFGNNDSFDSDYGKFKYNGAIANTGWRNNFLSTGNLCQDQKISYPCLLNENKEIGYYSAYIKPKLRLISLNTVIFSPKRSNQINSEMSMNELNWLNNQLYLAEKKDDRVLITMHIPPGQNVYNDWFFWLPKEEEEFVKLIRKYQTSIIGVLAAHTHMDELKIIRDNLKSTIATIYLNPGLSTSHGNAPAFRIFNFSPDNQKNWKMNNYTTFYFTGHKNKVLLKPLYEFNSYYKSTREITPEKMLKYFTAGNPKYFGTINYPKGIWIKI